MNEELALADNVAQDELVIYLDSLKWAETNCYGSEYHIGALYAALEGAQRVIEKSAAPF